MGYPVEDILKLGRQLSWTRPLTPYPGWRFDMDWDNPEFDYQIRKFIWSYFHGQPRYPALTVEWHFQLQLRMFLGNDSSRQLYIGGCIEPNEFHFLSRVLQPGMVFFDVGANEGLFTLLASALVGPAGYVWAFEPSGRELERLTYNLKLNRLTNVRAFPVALSDREGHLDLLVADDEHAGHNTIGAFAYDTALLRKEHVSATRLDTVVQESPPGRLDVLKVDIEGAELRFLQGARETLRRWKPLLLIELLEPALQHQGATGRAVIEFLRSLGYQIYCFDKGSGLPLPEAGELSENIVATTSPSQLAPFQQSSARFAGAAA